MKLSDDWKNDLIESIESNYLPVQIARILRETLQTAGFSLSEIKQISEDLQDEIEWQEILK